MSFEQEKTKPQWFDIWLNGHLHTRLLTMTLEEANVRARRILPKHKCSLNIIQVMPKGKLIPGYEKEYAKYPQETLHPGDALVQEGVRHEV